MDTFCDYTVHLCRHEKEVPTMASKQTRYDEEFKRTLVDLYHNGKTQASIVKEYGVSQTALTRWIKR